MTMPPRPRQIVEDEGRRAITIRRRPRRQGLLRHAGRAHGATSSARLDILVNNAGEQHPDEDIRDITEDQLKRTFQTNIFSMFFLTQAALDRISSKGAAIINCTSVTMYKGSAELLDYQRDQGRDHRLHPLAVAKPRQGRASA